MQFFLDTANIQDIKKYAEWGVIDGVTTNPTLVAKEKVQEEFATPKRGSRQKLDSPAGRNRLFEKRIKEIAKVINGPISAEVTSSDAKGMIKEGLEYAKWAKNIYVKLPMNEEGMKALKVLSKKGVKTNITLVFSASQALLAAKGGANFVSPFIGRLDDISQDGMELIKDIIQIFRNYNFKTKVLVASIRHPRHVVEAAKLGADISTMPAEVLEKLIHHPLTDIGIKKFADDWTSIKQ
ncbi:fructose-6-phosphate aldolase [Candidatus Peregrinibacteria bacterium]|nr:fructose-6-phosphate aldolase [Candidatus Peregrinibacteria bacterium]